MSASTGFIDPSAGGSVVIIPAAARPVSLAGKIVGLLDNTKEQADVILATLGDVLRERYGAAGVVLRRKAHYSQVASDALIVEMAQDVDVAIAALGG